MLPVYQTFSSQLLETQEGGMPHYSYPTYEGCPESIQLFWISRESVMWSWCNLPASQRRPYCV